MNIQERQFIETKVMSQKKSPAVAYVLWFFFGFLGGHRFYFGKTGSAIGMLALNLLTTWWTFGIPILIWWLIDAFLIQNMLKEDEENIRRQAMAEVGLSKAHSAGTPAQSHAVVQETTPVQEPVAPVEETKNHVG